MSPSSVLKDSIARLEDPRPDQRLHPRYPIRLDLQYKLLNHGQVPRTGSGRTLNLSSGGIFFETEDPLPESPTSCARHEGREALDQVVAENTGFTRVPHGEDGQIDLAMNWPFLLDGACPLKLLAQGRIVRTDARGTAVKVSRHEFRTSKRSAA